MKLKITEKSAGLLILTTGVTLNYAFDGLNKLGNLYFPLFSRSAIVYRMFIELVCILSVLVFFNKKRLNWLTWFSYFLICFFIGNIYLKYVLNIDVFMVEQFIYFNKYFFIFFIFFATYKTLEDRDALQKIVENFKKVFIFNGYVAIIGLLFNIKIFSTFPIGTPRFGFDGLILAQNEASIFYLLGLFVFYYEWQKGKIPIKNFVFVLLLCLLTGMKAVFLGLALLALYHFFSKMSVKKIIYLTVGILTTVIVLILSFSKLKVVFGYYYWFFTERGFWYAILGGRNTFIQSRVIPYLQQWDLINYFIGGQNISNVDDYLALIEMDFIDIVLFFGILNGIIFLYLYKKYIVGHINNKFFYFVVTVFFFQAFFSGHFFTSSVNPIFIIIVFAYLNTRLNDEEVYK